MRSLLAAMAGHEPGDDDLAAASASCRRTAPCSRGRRSARSDTRRRSSPDGRHRVGTESAECRRRGLGSMTVTERHDPARGAAQVVRRVRGGQGHRRRGAPRRGVRLPRTQRRRQVQHDADDRARQPDQRRRARDPRHGPGRRRAGDPRRGSASARRRTPSTTSSTSATTSTSTAATSASRKAEVNAARRRAARLRAADGEGQVQGRGPLRRHEAPADDRAQPGQQPRPAAARRADHRSRPAGPPPAVGPAVPAQAGGRDAGASPPTTWTRPSSCATGWS